MTNLMTENRPPQIAAAHLSRKAVICLPDAASPAMQDASESSASPWDPKAAALRWGWAEHMIEEIPEAQGFNGSPRQRHIAWQRLQTAVTRGSVGILFLAKSSCLLRSADTLEILAAFLRSHKVLLVLDGAFVYPAGDVMAIMQRYMAEFENMALRQRLMAATRAKARSGHAVRRPPTGYVADRAGRWQMDPDRMVRAAIGRLFTEFERLGTTGRVSRCYQKRGLRLPVRHGDIVRWEQGGRRRIHAILTHPAFKGDYVFGRRVVVRGRTCRRRNSDEIIVVPGHHEGYVTSARFARIQARLRRNRRSGK